MKKLTITEENNFIHSNIDGVDADLRKILRSHDFSYKIKFKWKQWIFTGIILSVDLWLVACYITDRFNFIHWIVAGVAHILFFRGLLERDRLEIEFKLNEINQNKFQVLIESFINAKIYSQGKLHEKDLEKYKIENSSSDFFVSNFPIPVFNVGTNYLAFFPFFIMMLDDAKDLVSILEYPDMQEKLGNSEIVALYSNVPSDAEVVGTSWEKETRAGGRDKRYKDNIQYARVRCFYLVFAPKVAIYYFDRGVTSSLKALSIYAKAMNHTRQAAKDKTPQPMPQASHTKNTVIEKESVSPKVRKVTNLSKLRNLAKSSKKENSPKAYDAELVIKLALAVSYSDGEMSFEELKSITSYISQMFGNESSKLVESFTSDVCVAVTYDDLDSIFNKAEYVSLTDEKKVSALSLAMYVASVDENFCDSEERIILKVAEILKCSHLLEDVENVVAEALKAA